ncbi:MAG: hypothetical protein JXR37_28520 [Kiritimatiellae bacterium]|nr:hypothetical protein [Kiritimatiellia bacterium]
MKTSIRIESLILSAVLLWATANGQASAREAAASPAARPERTRPLVDRTLVFSRAQVKYELDSDYRHRFLDRPLLHDPSTAPDDGKRALPSVKSFARISEIAMRYGMDGLGIFGDMPTSRLPVLEAADSVAPPGFRVEIDWGGGGDVSLKSQCLQAALASRSACRVDGKLLVTSYHFGRWEPAKLASFLAELRAKHGDSFVFLPDISAFWTGTWLKKFDQEGALSEADIEQIKAHLRPYLDVADGLHFSAVHMLRTRDRKFHARFYEEIITPVYRGLFAEPAYRKKYLGLSACVGYFYYTGSTQDEDGTKTLRRSFEIAMGGKPDVIILPEWDEANENTSVRPTVFNSFSTQRIVKYYMHRLKNEPLAPNPGDDTSIPNLVVSYRKMLVVGEALEIELLNIPDSETEATYTAALALKDLNARVVKRLDPVTLHAGELRDRTLTVPTEELASHPVLIPALTVTTPAGRELTFEQGLHHIRLRATWNWDCKWVKQPLRDLCIPRTASFAAKPGPGASLTFAGAFVCGEPIASVEVLENDFEVHAVDPAPDAPDYEAGDIPLSVEFRALKKTAIKGGMTVQHATPKWPARYSDRLNGNTRIFACEPSWWGSSLSVAIPAADAGRAVLDFDAPPIKASIPVRAVLEHGICGRTFDDGLTVTVSRPATPPKHPLHLNTNAVHVTAQVRPELSTSVFHMRVITKSGKTYRSAPLMPVRWRTGTERAVNVYSDARQATATVRVDKARTPDIVYRFDPACGSVLTTPAGRPFYASLGAYQTTCTGRGGGESRMGGHPFRFLAGRNYPENVRASAPVWVREDGVACLKFDGVGNFILFPQEVVPRRGSYTLSFDIKPLSRKPQILLAHYGHYIGSLVVRLDDGKLSGRFTDRYIGGHKLNAGLPVQLGQWNRVEIIYDLKDIVFVVNGKRSAPMPCPGPGLHITPGVFGGFGKGENEQAFIGRPGWFEGYLKSLRVRHGVSGT